MIENESKKGKEIEEYLNQVNMDPWYYIYENYIRDYSKSTQEEKPIDNLSRTTHESNKDKNKYDDSNIIDKKIDVHEYEQKCSKILGF